METSTGQVFIPPQSILPVLTAAHCTLHDSIHCSLTFGGGSRASERLRSLGWSSGRFIPSGSGRPSLLGESVGTACTSEAPTILVPSPLTCFTSTRFDQGGTAEIQGPKWYLLTPRFCIKQASLFSFGLSNNRTENVPSLERYQQDCTGVLPKRCVSLPSVFPSAAPYPLALGTHC